MKSKRFCQSCAALSGLPFLRPPSPRSSSTKTVFRERIQVTHPLNLLVMARRFAFRKSACMVAQKKLGVAENLHERQRTMPRMPNQRAGAMVLLLAVAAAGGCNTLRAIDQWKCDKLGWCCFGTRPSTPAATMPPLYAPTTECPPGMGAAPGGCCPVPGNSPAVTITTPGTVTGPATVVSPSPATEPGPVSSPAPSPSAGGSAPPGLPPPVLPGPQQ